MALNLLDLLVGRTYYVMLVFILAAIVSSGNVRLYGNTTKHEGGIEIYYNLQKTWHPLCGECWTDKAANVACKELGFSGGIKQTVTLTKSGILTGSFECPTGNEADLLSCTFKTEPPCDPCTVLEAAGVLCSGAVRLIGRVEQNIGLVQLFWQSLTSGQYVWAFLCRACWTDININVTCQQLGYSRGTRSESSPLGSRVLRWVVSYQCLGNESELGLCPKAEYNCSPCENAASVQCVVDGGWSSWNPDGSCSVTCGEGFQNLARLCNNPTPQYGGLTCIGSSTAVELCNETACPIDGEWSAWILNGSCSVTCGEGVQTLIRLCNNPTPQYGGSPCTGIDTIGVFCNTTACQIDGGWSAWILNGSCSVTCGEGVQTLIRLCNNPTPQYGGKPCTDSDTIGVFCNKTACQKTWNESCLMDSDCADQLICNDRYKTCDCRRNTDVWNPLDMTCLSSLEFLAIYSTERLDFASASEYCTQNRTGFLATRDFMNNLFLTCMDPGSDIWLANTIETTSTNDRETIGFGICTAAGLNLASELLLTRVNCSDNRNFVCVVNRTSRPLVTDETSCSGFIRGLLNPDSDGAVPLGTIVAAVVSCVIVLLVAAVVICILRKKNSKGGKTNGSANTEAEVRYNNTATPVADQKDSDHLSDNEAGPSIETDHYGYGILGKASRTDRNDDDDFYSHTNTNQQFGGEYDVFVGRKEDNDESGIYDHTGHGEMDEAQYDHFQGPKTSNVNIDDFIYNTDTNELP